MTRDAEKFSGFRHLTRLERLQRLKESCHLTEQEFSILSGESPLSPQMAEHLIEHAVGYFPIPLGLATHFRIDGVDRWIPMAVEESSVIAAASATAKWVTHKGSITTSLEGSLIIGQIQLPQVSDPKKTLELLKNQKELFLSEANALIPTLVQRGGGVKEIVFREVERPTLDGTMLVLHLLCDPCDAMGANLINQVCEGLKPLIESLSGEKVGLCILSNLVDTKRVKARVEVSQIPSKLAYAIQEASLFAQADPYRAATHNKGILNGIDPILIATGNDWRAAEAGIHAYAARSGSYQPISHWKVEGMGEKLRLVGEIDIPLAVGTQGGVTRIHPMAQIGLKILGITKSSELARICAAVGLVQNLGALRALSTVGIVKGHMQLHATNLAIAAGADSHEIVQVKEKLIEILAVEKTLTVSKAKEVLRQLRMGVH